MAGYLIQAYFELISAETTLSVAQIRAWNFTRFPNGPLTMCRDQTLPASTCFSALWQDLVGIWVGQGVALVGLVILFMPIVRKVLAIVELYSHKSLNSLTYAKPRPDLIERESI